MQTFLVLFAQVLRYPPKFSATEPNKMEVIWILMLVLTALKTTLFRISKPVTLDNLQNFKQLQNLAKSNFYRQVRKYVIFKFSWTDPTVKEIANILRNSFIFFLA